MVLQIIDLLNLFGKNNTANTSQNLRHCTFKGSVNSKYKKVWFSLNPSIVLFWVYMHENMCFVIWANQMNSCLFTSSISLFQLWAGLLGSESRLCCSSTLLSKPPFSCGFLALQRPSPGPGQPAWCGAQRGLPYHLLPQAQPCWRLSVCGTLRPWAGHRQPPRACGHNRYGYGELPFCAYFYSLQSRGVNKERKLPWEKEGHFVSVEHFERMPVLGCLLLSGGGEGSSRSFYSGTIPDASWPVSLMSLGLSCVVCYVPAGMLLAVGHYAKGLTLIWNRIRHE